MTSRSDRPKRILAIASGGGHWVQLLRLRPAFEGCDVTYVTVNPAYESDVNGARFVVINDATRWNKVGLLRMAMKIAWIIGRVRPDVILTTGAAPGYFAIRIGKLIGARTMWLDSVANVEQLSLSGERVGKHADLWLTQWPHLASAGAEAFPTNEASSAGGHVSNGAGRGAHSSESCATKKHSSESLTTRRRPLYCGSVL